MQQKIVFIGGPGSGKSTIITALKNLGNICMPEISREVTLQARKDGIEQLFVTEPLLFSEKLLEGRIQQYVNAERTNNQLVFFDRGIPSILAYLRYVKANFPNTFIEKCHQYKYTKVFHFLPWKEIYKQDNERYETFEESVVISKHLSDTYKEFGYEIIDVPFDTVKNRCNFILNTL